MTDQERLAKARAVLAAALDSCAATPPGPSETPQPTHASQPTHAIQEAPNQPGQPNQYGGEAADNESGCSPGAASRGQNARVSASQSSPAELARTIILRKLAAGPKTRHQLNQALVQAEVPDRQREQSLDRFTDLGLINDAEYAEILIRSKLRSAHHSRRALRQDLAKVGITGDLAEQALSTVDEDDEATAAQVFIDKRLKALSGREPQVIERRIVAALARRGFPQGQALAWVRDAMTSQDASSNCD